MTAGIPCTSMEVTFDMNTGIISIKNDGNGVCSRKNAQGIHWPEIIFSDFMSSGNFGQKDKKTGGKNGYGAKLTNAYSMFF